MRKWSLLPELASRNLPVAAMACVLTGRVFGFAEWNEQAGTYFENMDGLGDFELVQAVINDPLDRAAVIASSWELTQPATFPGTGATGIPFSGGGSATHFASINPAGVYGEQVQLFQKWYSAVKDMLWRDNCAGGRNVGDLKKCCVFPYPQPESLQLGNREPEVLLVPDVRQFNDCHKTIYLTNGETKAECDDGVGVVKDTLPVITELYLRKEEMSDILLAGANYNVTWRLRSTGQHQLEPDGSVIDVNHEKDGFNNRLVRFKMDFIYTTYEGFSVNNNYLGGATNQAQEPGNAECADVNLGCPIRLILDDVESYDPHHAVRRYLYEDEEGIYPYTPYTFSFCLGKLNKVPPTNVGTNMSCFPCSYDEGRPEMNAALCPNAKNPLGTGTLGIFLTTEGYSGEINETDVECPADGVDVPASNCRAAASLYIDGMMLTAGQGSYLSPVFDSLSPNTVWTHIAWESELNIDSGGPRTPVDFRYDVAQDGGVLGPPDLGAALTPSEESGMIALTATSVGRYFRYQADLISWDMNAKNYPALPVVTRFKNTCLRYNPEHDGSLTPALCRITMGYTPYAGQLISKALRPTNLKRWERLTFDAEAMGGASVSVDVLGENMAPAVMEDGTVLTGVSSGVTLSRLDPAKYPSLRIRVIMNKGDSLANQARLRWFKVEYDPMREGLALNRNALRLGRGEAVEVRFKSKSPGMVAVRVYDVAGQLVRELFRGELGAEEIHQESWDGTGGDGSAVAPGLYFVTLTTPEGRETLRFAAMR